MTKRTLLEEIRRIHEISGIKSEILVEGLINEAADPITKEMARIITSFFTGMEKEIIVAGRKIGQKKAEQIVSKIGSKTLTADEVAVVKALTKEVISADAAIIGRLTSDIFGEMQKLTSRTAKTKYFSEVKAALKGILPDEEVKNVVSGVTSKVKAGTTTTGSSSNTGTPTPPKKQPVLTPDPNAANAGTKPLKFDDLPPNASEIINATAKSSTEAAAFMQQVDLLGFNPQITELLKLSYSQNYKKSPAELVEVGNDLARMLNEKTYGPLKRLWSKIANNPSAAIEKTGKAAKSTLKWVVVLSLLASGATIAFALRDKLMKGLGLEGESLLPDVGVPDLGNGKKDDGKASAGSYKSNLEDFKKFVIAENPDRDINNFELIKDSETDFTMKYTNPTDKKVYTIKYKLADGNFVEN